MFMTWKKFWWYKNNSKRLKVSEHIRVVDSLFFPGALQSSAEVASIIHTPPQLRLELLALRSAERMLGTYCMNLARQESQPLCDTAAIAMIVYDKQRRTVQV
jgi:hypothetical protein